MGAVEIRAALVQTQVEAVDRVGGAVAFRAGVVEALAEGVVGEEADRFGLVLEADLRRVVPGQAGVGSVVQLEELRVIAQVGLAQARGRILAVVALIQGIGDVADLVGLEVAGAEPRWPRPTRVPKIFTSTLLGDTLAKVFRLVGEFLHVADEAGSHANLVEVLVEEQLQSAISDVADREHGVLRPLARCTFKPHFST